MKDSKYYKKHFEQETPNKTWLSKILICIILILLCLIITNFNSRLKASFKYHVLETNLNFAKINQIYKKYITHSQNTPSMPVSNDNSTSNIAKEEYNGSYKLHVGQEYPVSAISSGIIVYNGQKDEYQSTIIIQGNDGIDIWYSNVYMTDYSLYDYIKKGDIIGSSTNEDIIVTFMKDGIKISYDDYFI